MQNPPEVLKEDQKVPISIKNEGKFVVVLFRIVKFETYFDKCNKERGYKRDVSKLWKRGFDVKINWIQTTVGVCFFPSAICILLGVVI